MVLIGGGNGADNGLRLSPGLSNNKEAAGSGSYEAADTN